MKGKKAIIATLAYSDIFRYPLTLAQIHQFFHASRPASQDEIRHTLFSMQEIESHEEYFFLKGKKCHVLRRKIHEKISKKKLKKARRIASVLALIPTVKLIAVSGSLAQKNAGESDDIDMFFVTKPNTVWISRFFINITLILIGQKRSKDVSKAPDMICPNMLVGSNALPVPPTARSLYTARELSQLLPLIDKDNTHDLLLSSNTWIKRFLPNTTIPQRVNKNYIGSKLLSRIDDIFYKFQRGRMNITNEIVTKNIAKFHPRNTSQIVLDLYQKRLIHTLKQIRVYSSNSDMIEFNLDKKR